SPLASPAPLEATRALFGRALAVQLDLRRADVVFALDADFLARGPAHLRHEHDFAARRAPEASMNRLYVVEPTPTVTGFAADHRLARRPSRLEPLLGALARAVGRNPAVAPRVPKALEAALERFVPAGEDALF